MKILFIKTLLCPNKHYLDITLKSISKLYISLNYIKNHICDILFIGWIHVYKDIFTSFININRPIVNKIFCNLWVINYGKYKCINDSVSFVKNNNYYDYIIFLDHDIHFDIITIDYLDKIMNMNLYINNKKIGLMAFNHKQDIRHQQNIHENYIKYDTLDIYYSDTVGSIATGAYIIKSDIYSNIGEFSTISVYGLDDYYLCKRLDDNNYVNIVIGNCYVYHPFDNNNIYITWKRQMIETLINKKDINYYKSIEESINMFNNIK